MRGDVLKYLLAKFIDVHVSSTRENGISNSLQRSRSREYVAEDIARGTEAGVRRGKDSRTAKARTVSTRNPSSHSGCVSSNPTSASLSSKFDDAAESSASDCLMRETIPFGVNAPDCSTE